VPFNCIEAAPVVALRGRTSTDPNNVAPSHLGAPEIISKTNNANILYVCTYIYFIEQSSN